MTVPQTTITKQDGQTGVPAAPSPVGVAAIIAPCQQGPLLTPAAVTKPANALATYGYGLLTSILYYFLPVTKKPVVVVRQTPSVPAVYGAFTYTGSGTLSGSVTGSGSPLDDFQAVVLFTVGGTTGVASIIYQTSIDSRPFGDPAKVWSAPIALGTGLTIAIANTGISFTLVTAKTVVAQDYFVCPITGPRLNDADVATALTALGRANIPWEIVLAAGIDASSTTVANLDTFLAGLEGGGRFRAFACGAVPRKQDGTQTEAQYLAAQTTAWAGVASIRGMVGADAEYFTDPLRGIDMQRPSWMGWLARLLAVDVTIDEAQVDLGPLPNVRLVDANGNPVYHDESLDPGLDDQRLVTNRTVNTKIGAFVNNAKVISTPGSDYVYAQHVRMMNRACELAYGELQNQMSKGIFKDPATARIREDQAQLIEGAVNNVITGGTDNLGKKVVFLGFSLSRDDDLSSNAGATLTGTINLIPPSYIKGFNVNARFQRTVAVST